MIAAAYLDIAADCDRTIIIMGVCNNNIIDSSTHTLCNNYDHIIDTAIITIVAILSHVYHNRLLCVSNF